MECGKCSGTVRLPGPPKPKITEYVLMYTNRRGRHRTVTRANLGPIVAYCNRNNVPESGYKDGMGKTNWIALGIRRQGSDAIVDTQMLYKIEDKWYNSRHPKVWSKK